MTTVYLSLGEGVLVESMGESVVVFVPGQHLALRLDGESAAAVRAVVSEGVIRGDSRGNLTALIEAGVLRVSDALVPGGVGRRSLLIGGSAGAAIALAGLSLPAAAASSSPVDEPADDTLIGEWVIEGGPLYFRLSRATYPFLPAVEFVELTDSGTVYNYSRLTIGGQSVPIYSFVSQGLVEWSTDPLDFPGLSGDITGTFSVDNKSYTVTFQPGQPVPV